MMTIGRLLVQYWPNFIKGAGITMLLALTGTVSGFVIGLVVQCVRTIPEKERGFFRFLLKIIKGLLTVYVELFRGTPMMVQACLIYFGAPILFGIQLNKLLAGYLVVTINTAPIWQRSFGAGSTRLTRGRAMGPRPLA